MTMIRLVAALFAVLFLAVVGGVGTVAFAFHHFGRDLPEYRKLADYEPPITTRVYAGDGRLMAEFAVEKRIFVPIDVVPQRLTQSFISAEDKHFYRHQGIDLLGIVRAALTNVQNLGTGRRLVGASTITQQVAKNFLVGSEVSFERKIKEAIISFRIEKAFSKNQILELYLNEIYLGRGSYGVAAAALSYFDRSLDELTLAEAAFLAALPKAPNNYDPERYPEAALARRDWVIDRMLEDGHITVEAAAAAKASPIVLRRPDSGLAVAADYFAEEIRRQLRDSYGEKALYQGGLVVRASLDPALQGIAEQELRRGLEAYDRRHGWRGPVARLAPESGTDWQQEGWHRQLAAVPRPPDLGAWSLAVVLEVRRAEVEIGLADGSRGTIPFSEMTWARPWREEQTVGPPPKGPSDVVAAGDVVAVEPVVADGKGNAYPEATHGLRQIPDIGGAIVALDPHTGRVLAMSGGYSFQRSEFNRATQALRQPGSAFKPFVYLTALEAGYAPTTLILDAPFIIDQGPGLPKWNPANYTRQFYGPTTMRVGLEKSRNLMTVRLAQTIGMEHVADTARRFGIVDAMPPHLSFALGAAETTLLRLSTAYAMLVNGGKRITPTLVDRIQDRHGRTVFQHDRRPCAGCQAIEWTGQPPPFAADMRGEVTDPASAYQVVSMLQGVVQRGTGVRVAAVAKPVAGKTGTTNDSKDSWFIGFTPDLVVGVFAGFDEPRTLGRQETGASVAAPIFRDFMIAALKDRPAVPFRIPPGIRLVRVNTETGHLARPGDGKVILEAFKPGAMPTAQGEVIRGVSATVDGPAVGTGGLY